MPPEVYPGYVKTTPLDGRSLDGRLSRRGRGILLQIAGGAISSGIHSATTEVAGDSFFFRFVSGYLIIALTRKMEKRLCNLSKVILEATVAPDVLVAAEDGIVAAEDGIVAAEDGGLSSLR